REEGGIREAHFHVGSEHGQAGPSSGPEVEQLAGERVPRDEGVDGHEDQQVAEVQRKQVQPLQPALPSPSEQRRRRRTEEQRRAPVDVTLLDRRNHHVFQPLLYQVATAGLSAPEIAAPLRSILRRQPNVAVLMAEVVSVDVSRRVVVLSDGEMPYDYLILATGATHSYFGHDAWARHAPGLKSIEDALEIRRRLFVAFERAERETDASARRVWLTFLVVGGGPTGVELAGTVAEIARHTLAREFRRIDPSQARVVLLEGTYRVLPPYPPGLSQKARQQLEGLGVEVRTSALVTGVDEGGVWLGAERLAARTVLWAAGVAASPVGRSLGAAVDRAGRVQVEKDL